jgi:hypothetical protein
VQLDTAGAAPPPPAPPLSSSPPTSTSCRCTGSFLPVRWDRASGRPYGPSIVTSTLQSPHGRAITGPAVSSPAPAGGNTRAVYGSTNAGYPAAALGTRNTSTTDRAAACAGGGVWVWVWVSGWPSPTHAGGDSHCGRPGESARPRCPPDCRAQPRPPRRGTPASICRARAPCGRFSLAASARCEISTAGARLSMRVTDCWCGRAAVGATRAFSAKIQGSIPGPRTRKGFQGDRHNPEAGPKTPAATASGHWRHANGLPAGYAAPWGRRRGCMGMGGEFEVVWEWGEGDSVRCEHMPAFHFQPLPPPPPLPPPTLLPTRRASSELELKTRRVGARGRRGAGGWCRRRQRQPRARGGTTGRSHGGGGVPLGHAGGEGLRLGLRAGGG